MASSLAAPVAIRAATADDAEALVAMWRRFAAYLRSLGDDDEQNMTAEIFRRDGFGDSPAFSSLIAEWNGRPVGYAVYHLGYDMDRACRLMFLADLWVDPEARRHGVGRALMRAAADIGRSKGVVDIVWSVFEKNRLAMKFYRRLGGRELDQLRFMHMPVDRLLGG